MSRALWCVKKGFALAPETLVCKIGVSTSIKPLSSKYLRIKETILLRVKKIFLESVKAHWFFYLLYIVVLYLIKSSIVLGDYFIEISMLNMYFELSKNAFSDFVMAFAYTVFDSTAATLFFILLPVYFLVFSRRKDL